MSFEEYRGDPSLNDHKRKGSKLEAPFSAIFGKGSVKPSLWHIDRLPECIWVAELLHHLPYDIVLDILVKIHIEAKNYSTGDAPVYPSFASWWTATPVIAEAIIYGIDKPTVDALAYAMNDFSNLYPKYPICSFLSRESKDIDGLLVSYKYRLDELLDRFSPLSTSLLAVLILAEMKAGRITFSANIEMPNLMLLFGDDIESDEYKHAASFVRAHQLATFAMLDSFGFPPTAPYFWNRGLELESRTPALFLNER